MRFYLTRVRSFATLPDNILTFRIDNAKSVDQAVNILRWPRLLPFIPRYIAEMAELPGYHTGMAYIQILRCFDPTSLEVLHAVFSCNLPSRSQIPNFIRSSINSSNLESREFSRVIIGPRQASFMARDPGLPRRIMVDCRDRSVAVEIVPDNSARAPSPIATLCDNDEDIPDLVFQMD